MSWYPFGSTLCFAPTAEMPYVTRGNACQRNGLMYQWAFDGSTGAFVCIAKVDGINVSRPPIKRKR